MAITLREKLKSLPTQQQEKIACRTQELIEEEMTLQKLRSQSQITPEEIASLLGVGQDRVSDLEKRNHIYVSILRDYIHALGGKLHLVVEFPERTPIQLLDREEDSLEVTFSSTEE